MGVGLLKVLVLLNNVWHSTYRIVQRRCALREATQNQKDAALLSAKKQLEEGTWPEVMTIFGYPTPRSPRASDEEFQKLQDLFRGLSLHNIANFTEGLQLKEKELNVSLSYNLSLRYRTVSGSVEVSQKSVEQLFACPEILVGTRRGMEGAFVWFNNLSQAMTTPIPIWAFIMDKIFGRYITLG